MDTNCDQVYQQIMGHNRPVDVLVDFNAIDFTFGESQKAVSRYCRALCDRLSTFVEVYCWGRSENIQIRCGSMDFHIYCNSWRVRLMSHFYTGIGVPYYEHGNFIKLSRAAVLSKLLAIAAIRDGIHMAIAQLLPQPVAEEITPSIWVLDEVFGVFDSDWIMDAYKLSGIIAEILPALASEIIPHMYALDEMIIV